MTDQELIDSIRRGNHNEALRELYKEFPKIKALIIKSGCNEVLATEIFNDSLILLIEKVEDPSFELTSKLTTFLYGINRFLVKNALRKQQRSCELEWNDTLIVTETDLGYNFEKEEKLKLLESILEKISEKCRKMFQLFYFKKESMESIASQLGFGSVNSAKTQKYKCLKRAYSLTQEAAKSSQG